MRIELVTRRAGYKRGTYYLHIKNKDLPLSILYKYEKAINYDFSSEIPDITEAREVGAAYETPPLTITEAIKQRDEWKEKYYTLLEKYLLLMEDNPRD